MDRVPLLRIGLLSFHREAGLKAGQTGFQGPPRIIDRKEQHPVAEVLDGHMRLTRQAPTGQQHITIAAHKLPRI